MQNFISGTVRYSTAVTGDQTFNLFLGLSGAFVGFLFGNWTWVMTALLFMNFADILTGTWAAGKKFNVSSSSFSMGLRKKGAMWLVIIVAHFLDRLMPWAGAPVEGVVLLLWVFNEITSLLENCQRMGIPVPPFLMKRLAVLKMLEEQEEKKNK